MATDTLQNDSALATPWNEAFARFRELMAAFDKALDRHSKAENAADDCPREARFFDTYGLGMGMSRRRVIDALRWYGDRTGDRINDQEVADEFEAYQARSKDAAKRHNVDERQERIEELQEPWGAARDAIMAIPAPNTGALLVKLDIAFGSLFTDHAEIAMADARRLLGGRA